MTKLTLQSSLSPETREKLASLVQSGTETASSSPQKSSPSSPVIPVKVSRTPEEIKATEEMDKKQSRERFNEAREWLAQTFPKAFNFKDPVPLKVSIHKDIRALESPISPTQRIKALRWYVRGPGYLRAVMNGEWRHDLQGEPVEQISPEQKTHAMQQLEIRRQLWKAKTKIQREQNNKKYENQP